jgi:hypothetical protein
MLGLYFDKIEIDATDKYYRKHIKQLPLLLSRQEIYFSDINNSPYFIFDDPKSSNFKMITKSEDQFPVYDLEKINERNIEIFNE